MVYEKEKDVTQKEEVKTRPWDSLAQAFLPLHFFLIPIALLMGLHFRGGWVEPDTYAFYNRACLAGLDFHTPYFSKIFFSLLPCNLDAWFLAQTIFLVFSFIFLGFALEKFLKIPNKTLWLMGLSIYAVQFFTSFEDDHLAFPFVFISSWWYLSKPTPARAIALGLLGLALSFLVWEGAFFPIVILVLSSLFFALGGASVLLLFWNGVIGNSHGASTELTLGNGFFGNMLPYAMLYFYPEVKHELKNHLHLAGIGFVFLLLAFFQPKWGLYTLIPLLPLSYKVFSVRPKLLNKLVLVGMLVLLLMPSAVLFFKPPHEAHWKIFRTAAQFQSSGMVVLNDWGLGRYFQFVGGIPSQAGGYSGEQNFSGGPWYWLGPERKECFTIINEDLVFFQRCVPDTFK